MIDNHAPNGFPMNTPDKPVSPYNNAAPESPHPTPVRESPLHSIGVGVRNHAERCPMCQDSSRIDGVTGVILAGGISSRMGTNKALLEFDGTPLISLIHSKLSLIFREVIIITNSPREYAFIPCRTAQDIYPGVGSIAGLHSGLVNSATKRIFVVACDMPSLSTELIRRLCAVEGGWDAIVPVNDAGYLEPLHALYSRSSLAGIQELLDRGDKSILKLFDRIRTRKVEWEEIMGIEGAAESFRNVNTPGEYEDFTARRQGARPACGSSG